MKLIRILLLFFILVGCNGIEPIEEKSEEMEPPKTDNMKLNYLALGDSYTIGEGVLETENFPYQLIYSTFNEPHDVGKFKTIAMTGWTTDKLLEAMDAEELEVGQFDFITLLIGVNNQFREKPFSQYEEEFNLLIDRAIALTKGDATKVIVVSIPDYSVTPFAAGMDKEKIVRELKRYNDYNEAIAKQKGARYVYITDLTLPAANDLSLLAVDKLHPSGKNYAQWVLRMIPEVNEIIDSL